MALDRGTLANIDRRLFAELEHSNGVQMVKVPVSQATWSTWRRCCEAIGLSMGEGIAGLISHALKASVGDRSGDQGVFEAQKEGVLRDRVHELESRERELAARAHQLSTLEEQLWDWERRLRTTAAMPTGQSHRESKVGRNEQCPCGSGLKYKRCHGAANASDR